MKMDVEADAKREFNFACSQIQLRIDARMDAHVQILTSAAALFDASDVVTREKWHAYTMRQKVEQHLPGIQGIGFSMVIPRERLEEHIQEIRRQGFPDYNVKPEGDRETYTSIIYLEPFSGRNLQAFGYDMFSEPVRRMAMERAMDSDGAALSGKVTLVQEIDQDVQAGTLIYVPLYRKGLTTDSVADRRAALFGWVYSPYRMKDLMQGILKGWDLEDGKQIRLQIFDNEQLSTDLLLYDSQPKEEIEAVNASRLTLQTHTAFNEHIWYLLFTQTDGPLYYGRVYGVFFGGAMISLLLFRLLISLLNTRFRAQQLADQLTVDLRENEEKYRIIFNNEIYAICIFDLETLRLLDVNDAYTRLYGYSREELISGMTIHDITAEHQVSDAATRQAIREGTIFIPLRYHRKKDGTVFSVEIVGGPYVWKGQKVMFALMHDITERKHTEEALHDYRWRLQSIIEGTHVGTWEWNVQTGETVFNETWAEIVGYTLDELSPISIKSWEALVHPDDRKHSGELLEQHFTGELPYYDCECRMKHKDGHWVWVRDCGRVITRTVDDKPLMMFGTHTDITKRKHTEGALRESEERLRNAQRIGKLGSLDWNLATNELVLSEETLEIYGLEKTKTIVTLEEIITFVHPEDKQRVEQSLNAAIVNKVRHDLEHRVMRPDGEVIYIRAMAELFHDTDGKSVRLLGTILDITDSKRAEEEKEELEAQNRQLQKAESLGRMAGAIAHHFNNQLYAVMGTLEMAMDDLPLGVNSNENLVSAMHAAQKAAEVSRLMLTYLGQMPGKHEPIDLSEAYRQSLTLLQAASPKGMILNADFPSSGPIINADAGQMHQILTNLVTNAWESISDSRGTIDLIVKTVSHEDIPTTKRFPIDWQPQKITYACMEVSDTGCGIVDKCIEKIFDPFFTTKFTGRGLGLPVVMGIVKAHGGGIAVESEPGRGSVFRVFLPVSTEKLTIQHDLPIMSEALPASEAEKLSKIEGGGTVLLIEDEEQVRNMAKMMLTRLGYTVLEAKDGVDAVEIFQQHQEKICFVLSDLTMPRMNGWDTLAALRKLSPDIPVILSSGYDEAQVMAGEHSECPNAFLGKPYQLKGLREMISHVLAAPAGNNGQLNTTNLVGINPKEII